MVGNAKATASPALHQGRLGQLFCVVVTALHPDVRAQPFKAPFRGVLIEHHYGVDAFEGKQQLGSVLFAHDGIHTPVGKTDVNDMSAIMLLSNADMRALFTGDLNLALGSFLADSKDTRLKAQFLKMPHHGAENLAPNSFFDWVNPSVVIVPAPEKLWLSERSSRARNWAAAKMVGTYVTGSEGSVTVLLRPDRYDITAALH